MRSSAGSDAASGLAATNTYLAALDFGDDTTALANYSRQVLEASKGDTSAAVRKLRQSAAYNLAIHLIGQAEALGKAAYGQYLLEVAHGQDGR